jgi:hypothetical protein
MEQKLCFLEQFIPHAKQLTIVNKNKITQAMKPVKKRRGSVVIRQGYPATHVFLVIEGDLDVV